MFNFTWKNIAAAADGSLLGILRSFNVNSMWTQCENKIVSNVDFKKYLFFKVGTFKVMFRTFYKQVPFLPRPG